jgi:quinol monooxygenase YgiN
VGAFFLYELYDDQAAIAAHLLSPHFLEFDALTRDWVVGKVVRTHVLMVS